VTRYVTAAVAVLLLASAVHAAAAIPRAPGWPRATPGGELLPGPDGGVVVVTTVARSATTRAFTATAALRWVQRSTFGCGNCDDGPQPATLQPDGTYGPIGVEGDDYWAVDARGLRVAGCAGVASPDGGCLEARPAQYVAPHPAFVSRRGASGFWAVEDTAWAWAPEFEVPSMAVRDDAGLVYAAFPFARAPGTQDPVDLLMAADPASRTIRWRRIGPEQALAALPSGVLAAGDGDVTAVGPDGGVLWRRGVAAGQRLTPRDTIVDARRGRAYLGRVDARPGVTAVDLATGAQLWKTRPSDRARLLSVGRGGRVYVAIDAPSRQGVRGLRLATGATAWRLRTGLPVRDALELAGGRVAVSAGRQYAPTTADRLTVLIPG
jgi:hypothetical protein